MEKILYNTKDYVIKKDGQNIISINKNTKEVLNGFCISDDFCPKCNSGIIIFKTNKYGICNVCGKKFF